MFFLWVTDKILIYYLEVYMCVPHGSHNKQRLFPQTALTGWALWRRRNMFPVKYGLNYIDVFQT
jgi:hypothetical protein